MSFFRRYTNLAATIHMLHTKKLTLLNPATWDDKNDAYYMAEYKRYRGAQAVLALCFAQASETYHHWRVFSSGSDGVCIEFHKEKVLRAFKPDSRTIVRKVEYQMIDELENRRQIDVEQLPFLKRWPYRAEKEFRIVFADERRAIEHKDFEFDLSCINKLILSPWMSNSLSESTRTVLNSIEGCEGIKITKSTLVNNERWKGLTARVARKRKRRR